MNYTEKEQKGIDKVANMNRFFDKVLMPAVGVLLILLLAVFIVNKARAKFGGGTSQDTTHSVGPEAPASRVFDWRTRLLADYDTYAATFADCGYAPAEGYPQELALRRQVDDELVIFQFSDSVLGDFTIVKFTPSSEDAAYRSLSLTVSSPTLLNVTVKGDSLDETVTFTATDFSTYREEQKTSYQKLMKAVSQDELQSMYAIFETDIQQLARSCGLTPMTTYQ